MSSSDAAQCPGSGRTPKRWPAFSDHHRVECPVCDVKVPVYLRRLDHHRRPSELIVGDHAEPVLMADLCGTVHHNDGSVTQ